MDDIWSILRYTMSTLPLTTDYFISMSEHRLYLSYYVLVLSNMTLTFLLLLLVVPDISINRN